MSALPTRQTEEQPPRPAGRLEFRVRLPAVLVAEEAQSTSLASTSPTTRGMDVLNGILDKRLRSRGFRPGAGSRRNRVWLVCATVIGLSTWGIIHLVLNDDPAVNESPAGDVTAADDIGDFEPETTARSEGPQAGGTSPGTGLPPGSGSPPRPGPVSSVAIASEAPRESTVHAVYHTATPVRSVWLDGTIVPDDSDTP